MSQAKPEIEEFDVLLPEGEPGAAQQGYAPLDALDLHRVTELVSYEKLSLKPVETKRGRAAAPRPSATAAPRPSAAETAETAPAKIRGYSDFTLEKLKTIARTFGPRRIKLTQTKALLLRDLGKLYGAGKALLEAEEDGTLVDADELARFVARAAGEQGLPFTA